MCEEIYTGALQNLCEAATAQQLSVHPIRSLLSRTSYLALAPLLRANPGRARAAVQELPPVGIAPSAQRRIRCSIGRFSCRQLARPVE